MLHLDETCIITHVSDPETMGGKEVCCIPLPNTHNRNRELEHFSVPVFLENTDRIHVW